MVDFFYLAVSRGEEGCVSSGKESWPPPRSTPLHFTFFSES